MLASNSDKDTTYGSETSRTIKLSVNSDCIGKVSIDRDSPEFGQFGEFISTVLDRNMQLLDMSMSNKTRLVQEAYGNHIRVANQLIDDVTTLGFIVNYTSLTHLVLRLINATNNIRYSLDDDLYFTIAEEKPELLDTLVGGPFITEIINDNQVRYVIYTNEKIIKATKKITTSSGIRYVEVPIHQDEDVYFVDE